MRYNHFWVSSFKQSNRFVGALFRFCFVLFLCFLGRVYRPWEVLPCFHCNILFSMQSTSCLGSCWGVSYGHFSFCLSLSLTHSSLARSRARPFARSLALRSLAPSLALARSLAPRSRRPLARFLLARAGIGFPRGLPLIRIPVKGFSNGVTTSPDVLGQIFCSKHELTSTGFLLCWE